MGCPRGLQNKTDKFDYCNNETNNPYGALNLNARSWNLGCLRGYTDGLAVYNAYIAVNPTPRMRAETSCRQYTDAATASAGYDTTQSDRYYEGCITGYTIMLDESQDRSYCDGFVSPKNIGCQAGWLIAEQQLTETPLPAPSQTTIDAARAINNCGITIPTGDLNIDKGVIEGCVAGYNQAKNGQPNTCPATGTPSSERDPRKRNYNAAFSDACRKGRDYFANQPAPTPAPPPLPSSIVPSCDPSLAPSEPGACGIPKFIELIKNIMQYLYGLAIPLAVLALAWGGFQIMTSAGNPGKVEEGQGVMKLAITGLVIMLASYLIIRLIFTALGVDSSITQGLF